jgi:hypothetical protein
MRTFAAVLVSLLVVWPHVARADNAEACCDSWLATGKIATCTVRAASSNPCPARLPTKILVLEVDGAPSWPAPMAPCAVTAIRSCCNHSCEGDTSRCAVDLSGGPQLASSCCQGYCGQTSSLIANASGCTPVGYSGTCYPAGAIQVPPFKSGPIAAVFDGPATDSPEWQVSFGDLVQPAEAGADAGDAGAMFPLPPANDGRCSVSHAPARGNLAWAGVAASFAGLAATRRRRRASK